MNNTKAIKGVIFDLDGTLLNSLADLIDACNTMLNHYGLESVSYDLGKTYIGNGVRKLVMRALPEKMAEDEKFVDEAEAYFKAEYKTRFTNKTKPYDGILDLLNELQKKGIPMGICTNKPQEAALVIVDTILDKKIFVDVVGQQADKPRKPDPTLTLGVAEQMGLAPENLIYVGDSVVDYENSQNAGMLPVMCTWGFSEPEKLRALEGCVCVDHPLEILNLL